jgi:hypothetical protein
MLVGQTLVGYTLVGQTSVGQTSVGHTSVGQKLRRPLWRRKKGTFFTMSFNVGLSTRGSVRSNLMRSLFSKTEKSDYERKNIQLELEIDALKSLKNSQMKNISC